MKRLIGCLICALTILCGSAAEHFNVLVVDCKDGAREHIMLDAAMTVKFLPDVVRICHPEITVDYAMDEVAAMDYVSMNDPKLYDGDHHASIDEVKSPGRFVEITADHVSIAGDEPITVYDMRGIEVLRAESDGSVATIHTASLPKGVYVVKSGSTILKLTR